MGANNQWKEGGFVSRVFPYTIYSSHLLSASIYDAKRPKNHLLYVPTIKHNIMIIIIIRIIIIIERAQYK